MLKLDKTQMAMLREAFDWNDSSEVPLEVIVPSQKEALDADNVVNKIWDHPVPPGSFFTLKSGLAMSTPEFYYLRMASQMDEPQLIELAVEICGYYGTDHLRAGEDYRLYRKPTSTLRKMRQYLHGAAGCPGQRQALDALRYVAEGSVSPMTTYLYLLLCLPPRLGGYGLERPRFGMAFDGRRYGLGCMPDPRGPYHAYDLLWPHDLVALQFTGDEPPTPAEMAALEVPGMTVMPVATDVIRDRERFDEVVRDLAAALCAGPQELTPAFVEACDGLRSSVPMPAYPHMRLTDEDQDRKDLS